MTRAIMTIHGFLTDTNDFGKLYDNLQGYDCVHKCKVPGHCDEVNFALFNAKDTIAHVLEDFDTLASKYDSVDVIGFSMGGALTTFVCSVRNVNKAVLVSPSNKYINSSSMIKMLGFYYKEYFHAYKESQGNILTKLKQAESWIEQYADNSKTSLRIFLQRFLPNINTHTFGVFRELMEQCNSSLHNRADKIATPTLVLWGELDELVPQKSIEFLTQYFDNITQKIYPDVGHAMLMTNRDTILIRDILLFLEIDADSNSKSVD